MESVNTNFPVARKSQAGVLYGDHCAQPYAGMDQFNEKFKAILDGVDQNIEHVCACCLCC